MKKLTDKEREDIVNFTKHQQSLLGGALVMQMLDADAGQVVLHTEIENKDVAEGKYLVSTVLRPLTDELKKQIESGKHFEL